MKVTIRDVAKRARVSVATVSHVINESRYVSPELRERVYGAIEALNYRPNKIASALSKNSNPLLALIVPDISNPFWSTVARAVQDITDRYGYSVIVCSSDGLLEREVRFLRSLSGWTSGLMLHPYQVTHQQVSQLIGSSVPVVILGDFVQTDTHPTPWDYVGSDNHAGARLVTDYLIRLGHRRIAFIQGLARTPSSIRRLAGFRHAFETAGLAVADDLVVPGDYTRDGGRRAMNDLLDMAEPPTAVFCANDLSALGALEVAQRRGYHVPQDLSVAGFDDIEEAAVASPPLTTVSQPPRRMGTVIAEKLIERLQGRVEPSRVILEGSLAIRESTAPPRAGQSR